MKSVFILLLCVLILAQNVSGDKGCPDNPAECHQYCAGSGNQGKCEKGWYSWRYESRCKCQPCQGVLILGACVDSIPSAGIRCDENEENCSPTG